MYINPLKSLNFNYNNKNTVELPSFSGSAVVEDPLEKQTLDNTQFKKGIVADEFVKSSAMPNIRKPNSKNEASSFTNKDLDDILFERRYYI